MKNKANRITHEQAQHLYEDLLQEAVNQKKWLKSKGLNIWVSPFEIEQKWEKGLYLFPLSYWTLVDPNEYLKPFSKAKEKADNLYNYAHKRYAAYVQTLDKEA